MKKIYLAGCIGEYYKDGKDRNYPEKWRKEVVEWFEKHSDSFYCLDPMDFYRYDCNRHQSESEVMRFDLRLVREADIILVNLKDLDKSLGTSDEIFYAFINRKPVIGFYEVDENVDVKTLIHPWKVEEIDRIEYGKDAMQKAIRYVRDFYYY